MISGDDWRTILDFTAVGGIAFMGGLLVRYGRRARLFGLDFAAMVQDWHGHAADPARGVDFVAPVPQRLAALEYELRRNGGVTTNPATGQVIAGSQKDISSAILELLQQFASSQGAIEGDRLKNKRPQ